MDSDNEARAQFENYERLFDYINSTPELNAEVAFGTLGDYFKLQDFKKIEKKENLNIKKNYLHEISVKIPVSKTVEGATPVDQFPSIEGDFFSYADRTDNYWTGFFNSRPFYKWFDRYLERWVQVTDLQLNFAF